MSVRMLYLDFTSVKANSRLVLVTEGTMACSKRLVTIHDLDSVIPMARIQRLQRVIMFTKRSRKRMSSKIALHCDGVRVINVTGFVLEAAAGSNRTSTCGQIQLRFHLLHPILKHAPINIMFQVQRTASSLYTKR